MTFPPSEPSTTTWPFELPAGGDPQWAQFGPRLFALQVTVTRSHGGRDGNRDGVSFAIEADGKLIGFCGLNHRDPFAHTAELGITIGDSTGGGYGDGPAAGEIFTKFN